MCIKYVLGSDPKFFLHFYKYKIGSYDSYDICIKNSSIDFFTVKTSLSLKMRDMKVLGSNFKEIHSRKCNFPDFNDNRITIISHNQNTIWLKKLIFFTIGFTIFEYLKVMKCVRMIVPDPGTVYLNRYGCQRMHKVEVSYIFGLVLLALKL